MSISTSALLWCFILLVIHHDNRIVSVQGSGVSAFSRRKHPSSITMKVSPYSVVTTKVSTMVRTPAKLQIIDSQQLANAERIVLDYLESKRKVVAKNKKKGLGSFHLFGWRWHNMSLIREMKRLQKLSIQLLSQQQQQDHYYLNQSSSSSSLDTLKNAIDYVIGFNLKGMNRVEKEVMIPFLRKQLSSGSINDDDDDDDEKVSQAFNILLDHIESQQLKLEEIGNSIEQIISKQQQSTSSSSATAIIIEKVIEQSNSLIEHATFLLDQKNSILIPAMTQLVTEKEQKSTISKIAFTLGVLDSRLHLVGFHEAISNNPVEQKLWQENIPSFARAAVPMWKKSQYDDKTYMLNGF